MQLAVLRKDRADSKRITAAAHAQRWASKQIMSNTYRFLSDIDEANIIIEWFRDLSEPPVENRHETGILLHFKKLGPILDDTKSSPLINVFMPSKKRGALTTIGEVHFLTSPIKKFPQLAEVSRNFKKWLKKYNLVFSHKLDHDVQYHYYLEGSIKNWDSDVYALPHGFNSLSKGNYFVSHYDNDHILENLCKQLRLRGVDCI